ncbi:DNA replication/repair protein RecF [Flavihumibacter sp. UBA7668]|uniref:DNA replication/repair protein RecF n=1 Tax=Flavihumibacter sp. UBA7668 TaxID=1946542 RepID=UPI0025C0AC74|nr:DNA replication and repair protein RecF [Flavihumibacter sp. UBA7668]
MLQLESISVYQFKNYLNAQWQFDQRIVAISGRNGIGKTNLLDAIYFLCFTKSYFQRSDSQLVLHGAQGLRVAGIFQKSGTPVEVTGIIRETGKKSFLIDGQPCDRLSDHIGQFPAVFIAPDDVQIILDGSEERRRFLDALLSQIDHDYLLQLMKYNRVLQQRNSFLKQQLETGHRNPELLEVLDQQLLEPATYVFEKRSYFTQQLLAQAMERYTGIAGTRYDLELNYKSPLQSGAMSDLLREHRNRDLASGRTLAGIHRDDIRIMLAGQPFRQIASQGQRKSLLFSLKLAEFSLLKEKKGFAPLLLLDDVFEKLDADRMHNLLHEVCMVNDGQVFVTDTHPERLKESFNRLGTGYEEVKGER